MTPKQTTRGLYGMPFWHGIVYRLTTLSLRIIGSIVWRPQIKNLDQLPKEEPYLLLGNHSSMLDPFWAGIYIPRGVKAMASAAVLNVPYLGKWLTMCGCFPKMKYTKDRGSMETLQANFDAGYTILLFPEGNRSWDGRLGEVGQGIGRLIKRMQCKVVYVTLPTASLFQPRWATYPRWVPVEINYNGPYEYDDTLSAEDIWKDVVEKITVQPRLLPNRRTFGYKMAHGLPNYLWACPHCFAINGLQVSPKDGNEVECTQCTSHWRLTVDNQMVGTTSLTVSTAFDAIAAHFGSHPTTDESSEYALECHNSTILKRSERKMRSLGVGSLRITSTGLTLQTEQEVLFSAEHKDITAISVEIANLLQFRIDGVVHRIITPNQSSLMWAFFLRGWAKDQ